MDQNQQGQSLNNKTDVFRRTRIVGKGGLWIKVDCG